MDCYNAGATVLHLHVRNPATGHLSTDFDQFNYLLERVKKAVPKMIIQVGGSISFAPKGEGKKAEGGGTWRGMVVVALILFVGLVPFFSYRELARVIGKEKLHSLIFKRGTLAESM